MSKTKQRFWLISILLIYIAIAVAGFVIAYIIKTDFLPKTSSSLSTAQTIEKKSTNTPVGWKVYTDTNYNIQFAYPATDTIKTKSYGFVVTNLAVTNKNGDTDFQMLLLPKSVAQAVGQNFDSYYSMSDNTTKTIKSPLPQDNTTEKFTKISNTTINGNRAVTYQSLASNAKPGSLPEVGTFIEIDDNIILISTGADNKGPLQKLLRSFQ